MKGAPIKLATIVEIVEEMRFKKVIKESLTKKDFYAMARYIKNAPSQHRDVLMDFAIEISKADNPRFDEARFRKAVLGESGGMSKPVKESQSTCLRCGSPMDTKTLDHANDWCNDCNAKERDKADYELGQNFGPTNEVTEQNVKTMTDTELKQVTNLRNWERVHRRDKSQTDKIKEVGIANEATEINEDVAEGEAAARWACRYYKEHGYWPKGDPGGRLHRAWDYIEVHGKWKDFVKSSRFAQLAKPER